MDRRELLKAAAGLACVGPVSVPKETCEQYILHYPVGHSFVGGADVDNGDIARQILEGLELRHSIMIPRLDVPGWELYKNVNGEFVPVRNTASE